MLALNKNQKFCLSCKRRYAFAIRIPWLKYRFCGLQGCLSSTQNQSETAVEPPASWSNTFSGSLQISLPSWAPTSHPKPDLDLPTSLQGRPTIAQELCQTVHKHAKLPSKFAQSDQDRQEPQNFQNDFQKSMGYPSWLRLWNQHGVHLGACYSATMVCCKNVYEFVCNFQQVGGIKP